jgi:hypothetical protein
MKSRGTRLCVIVIGILTTSLPLLDEMKSRSVFGQANKDRLGLCCVGGKHGTGTSCGDVVMTDLCEKIKTACDCMYGEGTFEKAQVEQTETDIDYIHRFRTSEFKIANATDALSHAACELSIDLDAKLMVVCSRSGKTARMVSRFRSPKMIIGLTTEEKAWRKLALSWAVYPVMSEEFQSTDVLFYHATRVAKETGLAGSGDAIVITGGITNGVSGNTSLIKYEILK